ncbi:hypothetical protein H920_20144 [Fukomys damarensis]|uniref:Uncharacterized protein n=1 Tax=Fukomys damarensis TaxID=885580 RepID=A0A091CIZ3_FUKDA|nr:hypothetical protein H920_20144 [Fukomys damarensis]
MSRAAITYWKFLSQLVKQGQRGKSAETEIVKDKRLPLLAVIRKWKKTVFDGKAEKPGAVPVRSGKQLNKRHQTGTTRAMTTLQTQMAKGVEVLRLEDADEGKSVLFPGSNRL